ncbi:mRNA cleavage and polyadenylation factor subunit, partial [Linderina pennispora]
MFTYCREVLPASSVDRSVSLSFTGAGKTELVLARGNVVELYEVEFVKRRQGQYGSNDESSRDVPSDEYMHRSAKAEEFDFPMITGGARRGGRGGDPGDSKVPQLHLVGQWSLNGAIKDMKAVRCGTRGRRGIDSLLLSFSEAKMSLVSFEASTQTLVTESIHYYEHETLKPKSFNDHQTCNLRVDPAGRCALLRIYEDQVAVLPLIAPDEPSRNGTKPYMDSYVINLRAADIEIHNVRDFVFLNGYLEPTLAVLHERQVMWAGMAEKRRDTCVVSMVSLDLGRRVMSVIQTANGLPYDSHTIVPVPQPIGGVVVMAACSISHISNGTLTCISVLSKLACYGIGVQMRDFIDRTNMELEMVLDPSRCGLAFVRADTLALWTHMGQVFLVRLAGDGRRVERMVVKQIAGIDFRKDEQRPQEHSWDIFNVLPSSVTEFRMGSDDTAEDDAQLVFVGGRDGRSVLLEISEAAAGSSGATAAAKSASKNEVDDIDAMLYGDQGMGTQHTLSASAGADGGDSDSNGQVGDGQDALEGWHRRFKFTVHDEILGTGPIVGMDVGASALATSRSTGDEGLELVTCAGSEWRGSLRVQQRHVRPDVVASFDLPGAPVRRVWTVRCRKEYNIGGVMQAADDESLEDVADTFMVLSRDSSSAVFRAGDELSELERSGFCTTAATVDVQEILGHTRVVQVLADSVRVVNAQGRETQTIKLDVGVTVVSAQISDPYVLLKTSDGRFQLFEANTSTRKLAPAALPATLSGIEEVVATAFFEDTFGVLTSTKEWIERNPEQYAELLDESSRTKSGDDAELDYLYTDRTAEGKRRAGGKRRQDGARKRQRGAGASYEDLYEDEESDDSDAASTGEPADGGEITEAGRQEVERSGAESRMYLAVVWQGGDLSLLRLPQLDEVWRTPRFDYMAEVLAPVAGGSGEPDDAAGFQQATRRLDQLGVVQLGGRDLRNTHLVAVTTAGEVAVYRAFEHCARDALDQAQQVADDQLA